MVWNRALKDRLSAESGAVITDWGGRLPVAIVYANSYHIGMSNLGVHALYKWFNSRDDFVAERVFWDEEPQSTSGGLSVESRRPLPDFSVLAFSVSFELDYLNIPRMLKSAGIPVFSNDRDESYPLVIGGGAVLTANPMPVAPFFDAVCIGEAEAILPSLSQAIKDPLDQPRQTQLERLAAISGVYVPSLPAPVKRQHVSILDDFMVGTTVFTEDTEFGDMFLLEVQRGCRFSCRFCLVASSFYPFRYRSIESLLNQARLARKYRNRIALVGPVVSEYPHLAELLRGLKELGYSLSIGSMRVKPISTEVLNELVMGGVKSLTIAPEAGTPKLRRSIGKGFSDDDITEAVRKIGGAGIRQLTLYSMVGLPGETDADVDSLASLVLRSKVEADKHHVALSLNVSAFIPKAHSPFEREPMASAKDIDGRFDKLERSLSGKGVKVKPDTSGWGEIQAALARGDDKLAGVIEKLDKISLAGWRRSMKTAGLSTEAYAHRRFSEDEPLPWDIISM
ncbi:radical SAM protein [Dehalogenimonas etheniformans]|uniref:Radical SAM protein n=1 Tax=Dehalogenimonas etheniformans TaxID=1536648 RepID=A0A2P5P7X3_9CHLR|nr:radical SAM protein [Dehalogenimonas etheniformans]PPD58385.1 radical SAM protein [Dehalogenimonas etheniformans]QNT76960.1 radical SAM protein [Dehalogenimonas etheniformans]